VTFAFNPQVLIQWKSWVYILTVLLTIALTWHIYKKYALTKYQMMIFILLVVFWSAINIVRAYRKAYAVSSGDIGGLAMDGILGANIAASYGLVSIFVRLPVFALSDTLKSRRALIGAALMMVFLTSIWVVFKPDYLSLMSSSLALGVGASMLALFNVFFSETFSTKQAMVSVSILSIAPLLAEFIVAPLQFLATQNPIKDYGLLWAISAGLAFVGFLFLFRVKDNKEKVRNFSWKKIGIALSDRRFLLICVLAVAVSFIRFASSGSNMVAYAKTEDVLMADFLIAYLDVIFSLFQLVAGVIAGLWLKKKIGVKNTLLLGLGASLVFTALATTITNPVILFITYSLNGFGYGITYNVLLGLALQPFAKDMREVTMGIYQTFFAVGIYYGDKIYALILQNIPSTFEGSALYQLVFTLISGLIVLTMLSIFIGFSKKNREFIES
jgi:hypothetical protein